MHSGRAGHAMPLAADFHFPFPSLFFIIVLLVILVTYSSQCQARMPWRCLVPTLSRLISSLLCLTVCCYGRKRLGCLLIDVEGSGDSLRAYRMAAKVGSIMHHGRGLAAREVHTVLSAFKCLRREQGNHQVLKVSRPRSIAW